MEVKNLTSGQAAAFTAFFDFLRGNELSFSLQGGAGVGKTYLISLIVKALIGQGVQVAIAAPTHKACRVLRGKLDDAGIPWVFKPQKDAIPPRTAIVDTTAALLGVRPLIDDEQDENELKFKNTGRGSLPTALSRASRSVLIIDEVSMVGREDLEQLKVSLTEYGAKLLAVGDDGQLPPVKKSAINFEEDFDRSYLLDEVVRQAKGSSIVALAWAVRAAADSEQAESAMEQVLARPCEDIWFLQHGSISDAFIDNVALPGDDERERAVYIAYRNAVVNAVQEKACKKLYGHGRGTFKPGQLVISGTAGYREEKYFIDHSGNKRISQWPKMVQVVANADQLRVLSFDESRADPVFGIPVTLERVDLPAGAKDRTFETFYLSEEQYGDPRHPFNVEKAELLQVAKDLQLQFKRGNRYVDDDRKAAWTAYFKHEQRIISFTHPFAITSHKSQGSTYKEAYVNVADLLRFNKRALYVAVTRPSKKLVV